MSLKKWTAAAVEPVARKASAAITMRLVGYAIVRRAVGFKGLQEKPWSMSRTSARESEYQFRKHFKMSSDEWCSRYLGQLLDPKVEVEASEISASS